MDASGTRDDGSSGRVADPATTGVSLQRGGAARSPALPEAAVASASHGRPVWARSTATWPPGPTHRTEAAAGTVESTCIAISTATPAHVRRSRFFDCLVTLVVRPTVAPV